MPISGKIAKKAPKPEKLRAWAKSDTIVSVRTIGEGTPKLRNSKKKLVFSKVHYLTERLGGVIHVAEAVHADKSRVSRWAKGSAAPDERNVLAIENLEFVCQRLSRFLDNDSADKWLDSPNVFLKGQRPIELVNQGRIVDVLSAANQEEAGSYA